MGPVAKISSSILYLNIIKNDETNSSHWATALLFPHFNQCYSGKYKIQTKNLFTKCILQQKTSSCRSGDCKSCLDTCSSCNQCNLCALCLGSSLGPCAQCKFCKGGAAGCKKLCNKGKNTSTCKTCIQKCS